MSLRLTPFQEALVLSLFPPGAAIVSALAMQKMAPCPIRVKVMTPQKVEKEIVLRIARSRGGVPREALVFPKLAQLGLPVPTVLAGPVSDPEDVRAVSMTLNSLLPGRTLQDWSSDGGHGLELALEQTVEAVLRLHRLTDRLLQDEIAPLLPHKALSSELMRLVQSGNAWVQEPVFAATIRRLQPIAEAVDTPLVFSNGDYQPANFLSDGTRLTGFVDFEKACFEDPLIALARYPVYDLNPLYHAGVVARFLKTSGFTQSDFAPRLALFCLRTLLTKTPVSGGTLLQQERRDHVLSVLAVASPFLKG